MTEKLRYAGTYLVLLRQKFGYRGREVFDEHVEPLEAVPQERWRFLEDKLVEFLGYRPVSWELNPIPPWEDYRFGLDRTFLVNGEEKVFLNLIGGYAYADKDWVWHIAAIVELAEKVEEAVI